METYFLPLAWVRTAITREMLADSPFNLVSFFTGRAGQALGELEDQVFLNVRPGDGNAAITRPVEDIQLDSSLQLRSYRACERIGRKGGYEIRRTAITPANSSTPPNTAVPPLESAGT